MYKGFNNMNQKQKSIKQHSEGKKKDPLTPELVTILKEERFKISFERWKKRKKYSKQVKQQKLKWGSVNGHGLL